MNYVEYYTKSLKVPENVNVEISREKIVRVSGPLGSLSYDFSHMPVDFQIKDGKIFAYVYSSKRKLQAMLGTAIARIRNMIIGVTKGYTYKLKIVYSHFPISVRVKDRLVYIENFCGEKTPRIARIVGEDTKVVVSGDDVLVMGTDKDQVGQTAANIENATKIPDKDPRVFLDGIFIYEKKEGLENVDSS